VAESTSEYTFLDRCGEEVDTSTQTGVPLGDFIVSEDLHGDPQVEVWDGSGALELSIQCVAPVAVDQSTVVCMERFKNELKIIDLSRMDVKTVQLPGTNESTGDEQIFYPPIIALEGRKVLTHVGLRNDGSIDNYFYVFDIESEELALNQVVEGGGITFGSPWAMSHRGVLYGLVDPHDSPVRAIAIQTNVRPANSPWPFRIPTRSGSGNDNRGWIDVQ
jgi:hypothetical protein